MFSKLRSKKRNEVDGLDCGQQELDGKSSSSNIAADANLIEIFAQDYIYSVALLADGEHAVSGGYERRIQRWRVEDGKEVGKPIDAGGVIRSLAVTQDGKWIAAGMESGEVSVWDARSHGSLKVKEFRAHGQAVVALDVSADGAKVATGGYDSTLSVWSLPAGEPLLGPLEHDFSVLAVKLSPDGKFIATATGYKEAIRIYDSSDGVLLADFPIRINSFGQNAGFLAWLSDSNRLFVLSEDGNIHCLEVSAKKTLAEWRIHSDDEPRCIAVICNDTIVAAFANSSLSFWNTKTHQQVGTVIHYSHSIWSVAISPSYSIATAGDKAITLRNLCDILPLPYRNNALCERKIGHLEATMNDLKNTVRSLRAWSSFQEENISNLEKTVQELRTQLATSNEEKTDLNGIVNSLRAQNESSNRKITHLDESCKQLHSWFIASQGSVYRVTKTIKTLRVDVHLPETGSAFIARKINELELTVQELGNQSATCKYALRAYDKKYECETLYANGRIYDAIQHIPSGDLNHNKLVVDWLKVFTHRCVSRLQEIADEASSSNKHDEALAAYSTILLLTPSPPEGVVMGWVRIALIRRPVDEILGTVNKFKLPRHRAYQAVCNVLLGQDCPLEAAVCFQKMKNEISEETNTLDGQRQWELDFRQRCIKSLENCGDTATYWKKYDVAIEYYSNALSLRPMNINDIIVKCCKARVGLLEDELVDITQITERDPSNHRGYRRKHMALHGLGRYEEAFDAFKMMLSRMENLLDPQVQNMRRCYLDTTPLIRQVVEQTINDIPRVLIDTNTGRLYNKMMLTTAFEKSPVFNRLRSSMTTCDQFDYGRIQQEVEKFYEFAMLSHRWQPLEPSFQMVENTIIYGLPASPANDKLHSFCELVRSRGFRWAWSDTCCVDQSDKGVQQESIVAMFQWYSRAALTVVHLLDVHSKSQQKGSLWKSIWNTRGWTYQEYVASKVVQFYTEDWKPYLGLEMWNHKESRIILSEMEQVTKFTTRALATLQPGLTMVREKLCLASKRQTTRKEDIAYCLFGIFDVALPVIYGEGTRAVGRLLEHILTRSDNVTILAWTGISGNTHSYLPLDLTVYDQILPPHVPQPIETASIDRAVKVLQSSLLDPSLSPRLYEQLYSLPPLSLVAGRLRLSGLVFPLKELEHLPENDPDTFLPVYHAMTPALGEVRIKTKDNLVGMEGLVLIHPWLSPLIDEDFSGITSRFDLAVRAIRLVVRLRQPFGALLLASQSRVQYKRVATDSFIKVQIRSETPLEELMDSVRTVDVL